MSNRVCILVLLSAPFFLNTSSSSQTAALGVLGTMASGCPVQGESTSCPVLVADGSWLERHCSLPGIPGAPTRTYLGERHWHHREGTWEEKWRRHEVAFSRDMPRDILCEGCAPCWSKNYWGTVAVDDPRNTLEGLRPSVVVSGGIRYKKQQSQWEINLGKREWKMFPKYLSAYVFSQYLKQ